MKKCSHFAFIFYRYSENLLINGSKTFWGCVRMQQLRCISFVAADAVRAS